MASEKHNIDDLKLLWMRGAFFPLLTMGPGPECDVLVSKHPIFYGTWKSRSCLVHFGTKCNYLDDHR